MSLVSQSPADSQFMSAMEQAFYTHVKNALRDRILASVKEDIDKAVDDAMKTLKVHVQAHMDNFNNRFTHELILTRKDDKE